ncbi:MAG: helix-turn-helix domain-containing protein [Bryobacteraceae bacterium]
MFPQYAKVSEIAARFRVSVDAVYLWIREGKIPDDCIARIAGTIRVDEQRFGECLRAGELCQPRGRKALNTVPRAGHEFVLPSAADNFTTLGEGPTTEHRWTTETGRVREDHPFSPEMTATEK